MAENNEEFRITIHNQIWHEAYANLKQDKNCSKYMIKYENLLSTVFLGKAIGQSANEENEQDPGISVSSDEEKLREIIEMGLKKVETSRKMTEMSAKVQKVIDPVRAVLDIPLKNLSHTALPWAIVTSSLDILMKPTKVMTALYNGIAGVNERIKWYSNMTDRLLAPGNDNQPWEQVQQFLRSKMLDLYQFLLFYQIKSVCFYYRRQIWGILRSYADLDDWNGDLSTITESEEKLHRDLSLYKLEHLSDEVRNFSNELRQFSRAQEERDKLKEDKQCMKDLFSINPRSEIEKITDARGKPIKEIYDWIIDTEEYHSFMDWEKLKSPNLLRINGQAGTGKTMMSVGLIQKLIGDTSDLHCPEVIYFFIQDIGEEFNSSASIIRSLMWLLLEQNPALIRHLRAPYESSGATLFRNSQSFTDLLPIFENMLRDEDLARVLIIIDALDESKGPANQCGGLGRDIFKLLDKLLPNEAATSKIKILITTRPLLEIDTQLRKISPLSNATIQLDEHSLSGPINIYIDHQKESLEAQAEGRIDINSTIQDLKNNAGRTFIWVHLVCEQLLQSDPGQWKQTLENAPQELENLYRFLLNRLNVREQDTWFSLCKETLCLVMLAHRPLTLCELEVFFDPPKEISLEKVVQECRSFLVIHRNTVYPIHKSANDFLRKNHAAVKNGSFDDLHHEVFERSLAIMTSKLKRNMYDLPHHGVLIEEVDTPEESCLHSIQYFCQYWIDHLKETHLRPADTSTLLKFFHTHFLHWLEALSLLHILDIAMDTTDHLLSVLPDTDGLSEFLIDVKRFLNKFSQIISEAPLQTYVSTLVFAPDKSKVREIFQDEKPHWVSRMRPSDTTWSPLLRSIGGPGGSGYGSVVVSPKGGLIAAKTAESIDVLKMSTGTLVKCLDVEWTDHMAFSPCGGLLATIGELHETTVRIWDTSRWEIIQSWDDAADGKLTCAFSPRGNVLATASKTEITLWDIATWDVLWSITHVKSRNPLVTFSPDGHVVSALGGDVRLYHLESGDLDRDLTRKYAEHSKGDFETVMFSNDGSRVALYSLSQIKVLDLPSMEEAMVQSGGVFRSLAFSPDSRLLAIGEDHHLTKIWDTQTWTLLQTLETNRIPEELEFSANSQILLSVSDGIVRFWDLALNILRERQEGAPRTFSNIIERIKYSPTGILFASLDGDDKIAVWDPRTGNLIYTRKFETQISEIDFSLDGEHLLAYQGAMQRALILNARTGDTEEEVGSMSASDALRYLHSRMPPKLPVPQKPKNAIEYSWKWDWIVAANYTERLIWIPPEIRQRSICTGEVHGQTIASGSDSGRLSFLTFQLEPPDDEPPPNSTGS